MTRDVFLSAIVPVYNTATYIRQSIESILNQTYAEFELILVDDGSTDSSGMICDEYVEMDSRIHVIHMKNSGPLQARKAGMLCARGEYVTFADSDDWLEQNTYEYMIRICFKYNPDIIAYAYSYDNGTVVKNLYDEKLYTRSEIQNEIINSMMFDSKYGRRRLDPSLCCKVMKRELCLSIAEQVSDRISFGEDALITYPAVCRAESMYITNQAFYHYRMNAASCTHSYPLERVTEVQAFQRNVIDLLSAIGCYNGMRFQVEQYVRSLLQMMVKKWFDIDLVSTWFSFPYRIVPAESRLVIYGAGSVGKSYVNSLRSNGYAEIVGWVDAASEKRDSYNGVLISPLREIRNWEFELVLAAVYDSQIVADIRKHLVEYGIPEDKIIWSKPIPCY